MIDLIGIVTVAGEGKGDLLEVRGPAQWATLGCGVKVVKEWRNNDRGLSGLRISQMD